MKYCVYILKSQINNKYYIGATADLNKRIQKHNKGKVKSTKIGRPWQLEYSESYDTLSKARIRESQIKNWKKRLMIENLINGAIV